jgi:hypothetical protein
MIRVIYFLTLPRFTTIAFLNEKRSLYDRPFLIDISVVTLMIIEDIFKIPTLALVLLKLKRHL